MEHTAVVTTADDEDNLDIIALSQAMAWTVEVREAIRPVLLRLQQREDEKLRKRIQRAKKSSAIAHDDDAA